MCWPPVILGIKRLQQAIRGSCGIEGSTLVSWYWNSGTHSKKTVTSTNPKQNCFKFPALDLDNWHFMLAFMTSAQLKIVGVVQSIAYMKFDLLVSCSTWDPATLLMVNRSTLSVKSWTLEIYIFPLLDFRALVQCSVSNEYMLAPISRDPYKFNGSPLQDSPMMNYISEVSNSSSWSSMTIISRLMSQRVIRYRSNLGWARIPGVRKNLRSPQALKASRKFGSFIA